MAHRTHVHRLPGLRTQVGLDLKGLGELITASEWKRAAIVWAFTSGAVKGHKSTSGLSVSDFLAHDINGLNSKTTVAKYRKAWKLAIERGFATDVKPGDLIDLPITT
ncbi:Uncharacterised protein [Mycobacteroides abscessus subsp. massiliense]|nr:hypothetical protein E3G57_000836 [Mycobacteroides abscessus]SKS66278.1 Uncharacterised protein [Mycobacteroides abscessus subsp. massiliense]SKS75467.1 Uncharacterised protein [Mycobacteroides abscessus subsp. massiliense]SKT04714.1 Uncharacterised protein [Mycobacteroides abscessus subsp. massiliense]SKT35681.1 Uncharacterised protein [Mycobacteroides abscessus subsp. massiliense]